MSLYAFMSAKGSPGVTTAVTALCRFWTSGRTAVIAECDPAGGELGLWLGRPDVAGMSSFAASLRQHVGVDEVLRHALRLPGDVPALAGPRASTEAVSAITVAAPALREVAAGTETLDVLVDGGRFYPGSPAEELVGSADGVVVVVRVAGPYPHDSAAAVAHAADLVDRLSASGIAGRLAALVVAPRRPRYSPEETVAALGIPAIGPLPLDRSGAARLLSAPAAGWEAALLARSPLARASRAAAFALTSETTTTPIGARS